MTIRIERWEDQGGRTNRVTLVRGQHDMYIAGHKIQRDQTVVFTPEEWALVEREVLDQHGLAFASDVAAVTDETLMERYERLRAAGRFAHYEEGPDAAAE